MRSLRTQGGVIALEVCLAGHREGFATYMVPSWLRVATRGSWCCVSVWVTPAVLHEGIKRDFVAFVPAVQHSFFGCAFGHVRCGCPGFGLCVGSRWAPRGHLPGRGVSWLACAAAMC